MKELTGLIREWVHVSQQGKIQGDDGVVYGFSAVHWSETEEPQVGDGVRAICENGRDVTRVEYVLIENVPRLKIEGYSPEGQQIWSEERRLVGGPRRMHSDALAWMVAAHTMHVQASGFPIPDISDLLIGDHLPISVRGSVVKYCYGMAFELYFKWILTEAGISYRERGGQAHKLAPLLGKLPDPVLDELRNRYLAYQQSAAPKFQLMMAHVHGVDPVSLDWSTFDLFIRNLDHQKFTTGRYAAPSNYSIFSTISEKLSREMNVFIDSDDFFEWGFSMLGYEPDLADYR